MSAYTVLFNAITSALDDLGKIEFLLKTAQVVAEDLTLREVQEQDKPDPAQPDTAP